MVAMKRNLLTLVQNMLDELDADQVNSIADTIEATLVANVIANTYFDLIAHRVIPEHKELFKLDPLSDSRWPNYLIIPDDVNKVLTFEYNVSDDSKREYRVIKWEDPEIFLHRVTHRDNTESNVSIVEDINGGTELLIQNDKRPDYFTSFDDKHIVTDSYDGSVDSTLRSSKTRCYGVKIPIVNVIDTFTFDIDSDYFPYLYNEALSRAFVDLQKTPNQKVEQWSRRHRTALQSEKWRVEQPNRRRAYGRT